MPAGLVFPLQNNRYNVIKQQLELERRDRETRNPRSDRKHESYITKDQEAKFKGPRGGTLEKLYPVNQNHMWIVCQSARYKERFKPPLEIWTWRNNLALGSPYVCGLNRPTTTIYV